MVTGPKSDRAGGKGMGWDKKPLQRAMHILTKDCFNKILKGFSINDNFTSITQ